MLAGALLAGTAACSGASSTGAGRPHPSPTFTQLGTFAISRVIHVRSLRAARCPTAAFHVSNGGEIVSCDSQHRRVYVLDPPIVDQRQIDATTVGPSSPGAGWSVYLRLTAPGATAVSNASDVGSVAVVYDGVVVETLPSVRAIQGGLVDISGLSKARADRIAAALNPS